MASETSMTVSNAHSRPVLCQRIAILTNSGSVACLSNKIISFPERSSAEKGTVRCGGFVSSRESALIVLRGSGVR